jgi:DNA-binding transcriptional MocR family regulator
VAGVAMDGQGILPEALARAVEGTGARLLYTIPTIQNPTTRTMSRQRRTEIVAVAREYDLTIIEDDVYGPFAYALDGHGDDLVPLAQLAPERTFYASSASKTLAMGLRVGVLVAPDAERFDRCAEVLRASSYATSSLSALLVSQAILDGGASAVRDAIAHDATRRMTLARRVLGDAVAPPSFPTALHAWLPMPELQAERVANGALRRGVTLTPPTSYIVDGTLESGLRLCLNSLPYDDLERALRIVRTAMADEAVPTRQAIV